MGFSEIKMELLGLHLAQVVRLIRIRKLIERLHLVLLLEQALDQGRSGRLKIH